MFAGDRGAATVELAVLLPVFLLLFLAAVQVGLWWYARNLCLTAAQQGLQIGRTVSATPADAQDAATSFLARAGADVVSDPVVSTAGTTATTVRVQVSGTVIKVLPIPGVELRVTQGVEGAKERFTSPSDVDSRARAAVDPGR